MILNLPNQYTSWDEVFQAEYGQEVGFARETVPLVAPLGIHEIGLLVVCDGKIAIVPETTAELLTAAMQAGDSPANARVGILAGRNPRLDCVGGINSNVIILTAEYPSEAEAVVVVEGRNGGAVGKAELKFPADATPETKAQVLEFMRNRQGFKFLNQQVKG